ncbi:MAG: hypothetical protein ACT6QU_19485, partial [Aliihoeflea sp.]
ITTASSSVTNSGTITGAGAGITTAYQFDEAIGDIVGIAVGTQVTNSGTIRGESNDGVRLIGGGSVSNSGIIRGEGSALADGISIYPYDGQTLANYVGTVANSATGDISGTRFGVIMSAGGTLDNAGTITGEGPGGVLMQRGAGLVQETGFDGTLTNTGTITGSSGIAVQLGSFDDRVTLRTGSAMSGAVDAGGGNDSLTLDGDVLELTEAQQLTEATGFETLDVAAGYW